METVPDTWVFVVRGGLPIEAARLLLPELCSSAPWHIEDMGGAGYLVVVETIEAAGNVREVVSRIPAKYQVASFQKLKRLQSTGDRAVDQAIIRSIEALYGQHVP